MADMKPQQNDIEVVVEKNNRAIELVNLLKDGDRGVCCTQEYGTEEYELTPEHELKFRENVPALWKEAMLDETYMRRFLRGEEVSLVNVAPEFADFFSDEFEEEHFTKSKSPLGPIYIYFGSYFLAFLATIWLCPEEDDIQNVIEAQGYGVLAVIFPILAILGACLFVANSCCGLTDFDRSQFSRQLWYEFVRVSTRRAEAKDGLCGTIATLFAISLVQAIHTIIFLMVTVSSGDWKKYAVEIAVGVVLLCITIVGIRLLILAYNVHSRFADKAKLLLKAPYGLQFFWAMGMTLKLLGTKEDKDLHSYSFVRAFFGNDITQENEDMVRAIVKSIEVESKYESANPEHQDKNAPDAEAPAPAEVAAPPVGGGVI